MFKFLVILFIIKIYARNNTLKSIINGFQQLEQSYRRLRSSVSTNALLKEFSSATSFK